MSSSKVQKENAISVNELIKQTYKTEYDQLTSGRKHFNLEYSNYFNSKNQSYSKVDITESRGNITNKKNKKIDIHSIYKAKIPRKVSKNNVQFQKSKQESTLKSTIKHKKRFFDKDILSPSRYDD